VLSRFLGWLYDDDPAHSFALDLAVVLELALFLELHWTRALSSELSGLILRRASGLAKALKFILSGHTVKPLPRFLVPLFEL
jgi:hypothetical protein